MVGWMWARLLSMGARVLSVIGLFGHPVGVRLAG